MVARNCKTFLIGVLLFSISIFLFGAKEVSMTDTEKIVLNFDKSDDSNDWLIINDGVMGGVSESSFQFTKTGTGVFSGNVSLENNGGFASVRLSPSQFNLSDSDGIRFRVKGDGKKYKITLKMMINSMDLLTGMNSAPKMASGKPSMPLLNHSSLCSWDKRQVPPLLTGRT